MKYRPLSLYLRPQSSTHTQFANKALSNFPLRRFRLSGRNEFICIWISEITPKKKVPKLDFKRRKKTFKFLFSTNLNAESHQQLTTTMRLTNLEVHLAKQVRPPHSPGLHVTKTGNSIPCGYPCDRGWSCLKEMPCLVRFASNMAKQKKQQKQQQTTTLGCKIL